MALTCRRPAALASCTPAPLAASATIASRQSQPRLHRPLARQLALGAVCAAGGLSLAGKEFKSQKEAKGYVAGLLKCLTGRTVLPGDPHFEVLLKLLERHPAYAEKVALPPVQCFKVVVNELRGLQTGRELRFADQRGLLISFSVDKCIKQQGDSPDVMLEEAMRTAVRPQILAFLKAAVQRCVRCDAAPSGSNRLQVDHVEPFKHLAVGFKAGCAKAGLRLPTKFAQTAGTHLDCFTDAPADQEFSRRWQEYHSLHATLQLLCKQCHLQKSARQARATPRRRKP